MQLDQGHKFCVAPMMEWTDRHCRYFLRLISKHALLYTEMVTADAVLRGDRKLLLQFHVDEHPVALQVGGSDAGALAEAARVGAEFGYDEINLNVGCPSDRVQAGRFGACLMAEPKLVADLIAAMSESCNVPVTVKCRIGIDDQEDRKSTRLNSSHVAISYAVFCLKKKKKKENHSPMQKKNKNKQVKQT